MNKNNHVTNVIFLVILICVVVCLFFSNFYIKIVSDKAENLEKAIVVVYDVGFEHTTYTIELKKKSALNELYNTIKSTKKIKVVRHPRHSLLTSVSGRYEIQLFYSNGQIDRYGTAEKPQFVYRRLENNDNGYIIGENDELLEYVLNLEKNN